MADKVTERPIFREFISQMASVFWGDNGPTYVVPFVLAPTIVKAISDWNGISKLLAAMVSVDNLRFNLKCAAIGLPFVMWVSHRKIAKRNRKKIRELEQALDMARAEALDESPFGPKAADRWMAQQMNKPEPPPPTSLQAFNSYLSRKIYEARAIMALVSKDNLQAQATGIWEWEEGLYKGLLSALGKKEADHLLGDDSLILPRSANWKDIEGHWIFYRMGRTPEEAEAVIPDFKKEIGRVIKYLENLSAKTVSNHFESTFEPRDLDGF